MSLTQSHYEFYIYTVVVSFWLSLCLRYRMALYMDSDFLSDKKICCDISMASFSTKSGWHWFAFLGDVSCSSGGLFSGACRVVDGYFRGHYFIRNSICSI